MTTKTMILQEYEANGLLQAPFLSQVPKSEKDVSTDQPTRPLEADVVQSTVSALEAGQTHYVDVPGIMPLREAVASHLSAQGATGYDATTVVITASMQEARFLALQTLVEHDLAVPEVVHPGVRKALGVRPPKLHSLPVDEAKGLLPALESLKQVLEAGVNVVYLESPSRLTGAAFEVSEITQIGQLVETYGATLICDQGLLPWVPTGSTMATAKTTLIGDVFPGFGLEGLPLGFIATSSEQVGAMTSLKQIMSICTSTASQYAALKISETYETNRSAFLEEVQLRRQVLAQSLSDQALPGQAATILALKANTTTTSSLHEQGYNYADGADFGAPGVIRLLLKESLQAFS